MIPCLGVLVLNRGDLLLRMVDSIDYPVERLCIVVNGTDDTVADALTSIGNGRNPMVSRVYIERPFRNMGVAPAWNSIIKSWPECDYWMICNNDTLFLPGDLEKYHLTWQRNQGSFIAAPQGGFSCFILDADVVAAVGLFDENIWPIYHEDIDYIIRLSRAGISRIELDADFGEHGNGSWTIRSNADYQLSNNQTQESNRVYVIEKWGENQEYQQPWNQLLTWQWQYDPFRRRQHSATWSNFEQTANRVSRTTLAETIIAKQLHTDKDSLHSYCTHFYERELARYRDQQVQIVEIGIDQGGSLQLWAEWFSQATILGIDLQMRGNCEQNCSRYSNIRIGLGNAYDPENINNYPEIDILIDDGPHDLQSQLWVLQNLLPRIKPGGLLVIEDVMDAANLQILMDRVPDALKQFAEMIDLRHIKGRYDDLMLVVRVPTS